MTNVAPLVSEAPKMSSASGPLAGRADCPVARQHVIESARAMIPRLRERAAETEKLRRVPDATIEEFHQAGLFRILQPHRVGGFEFHPSIYLDVCGEIARGCASSSWVLANLAAHHLFMALWDPRAQDDVWDPSPDTLIGSSYIFTAGRADRVPGGYIVSGHWPFSSGIDPCQWTVVGAGVPAENGAERPEHRYFLLPRADYEIIDTWHVVGLRGTGSKDLVIDKVFVPDYRTLPFAQTHDGTAPGLAINPGPLFRLSMHGSGGFTLLATLYGAARSAVEEYVTTTRSRSARVSGKGFADMTAVQTRIAEADAHLDTVELITRAAYDSAYGCLRTEPSVDPRISIRLKRDSAFAARLCVAAVDMVFAGFGGSALFEDHPVQRIWRDVHAGAAQFGLQWDVAAPAYGRTRIGLPSGLPGFAI